MQVPELREFLDQAHGRGGQAVRVLAGWGLHDAPRGQRNLAAIAEAGVPLDLLAGVCGQLAAHLPRQSDADMALNNLERFVVSQRSPLSLATLFERDREALPVLLQIFSTSQYLSDQLVRDSESYDLLRITEGAPVQRDVLAAEICAEVAALTDEGAVMQALRRFKHRETLRIAYGDIIRDQPVHVVTRQISHLADALLEAALLVARRKLEPARGIPRGPDGRPAKFVVLGMGKLGGEELNYSSDIDLIFVYDHDGRTDGPRPIDNVEYFDRLGRELVRLLQEPTSLGVAYRIDLRLRPDGSQGPVAQSLENTLRYYDTKGRTWERQAYVKARAVAGDMAFGQEFLRRLAPWIYRRYLGLADIAGIKALKRRIEHGAERDGADERNVKTGRGGIRDIEFAIQFLQLLNGGDQPEVRTTNTLEAIGRLERVGCLTHQEAELLKKHYAFLRDVEHRLQIMFDLQTHELPAGDAELRKLAIRLGFTDAAALADFKREYERTTSLNRKILDHLLHDAFGDDAEAEPEVDLVLTPQPSPEQIREVLAPHRFQHVEQAYRNLMGLATEKIPFLSTRRCRHFLASIAPKLLKAIAATPDPDSTLVNLNQVSDSLGGKGVLWELFSFNPPSLHLYVELCALSPFLSGILMSNPGMIDELLDSLLLDKLPTGEGLRRALADLCYAAEDIDPILHSFKNAQQLRVGVREILGKADVQATTRALSHIAEACLEQIALREREKLVARLGEPTLQETTIDDDGQAIPIGSPWPCELVILAMGKFGGAELNYHSDLDLMFLYEGDGVTQSKSRRISPTTNQHFFDELGQRIIKSATLLGPHGRLFEVDARLRPTGRSGALTTSLSEFARYFESGEGQLWERQALCKARVVFGSASAAAAAIREVRAAILARPFTEEDAAAIRDMRRRLEETAGKGDLKRGPGGLVDIEFLVQTLQLRHAREVPQVLAPDTLGGLAALCAAGVLDRDAAKYLDESYRFLRKVESRLRLMYAAPRNELPVEPTELARLSRGLNLPHERQLVERCEHYTRENRRQFERWVG